MSRENGGSSSSPRRRGGQDEPNRFRPARGTGRSPGEGSKPVLEGPGLFERVVFGRIRAGHLAAFCRQAASYFDSGVDLIKAFGALQKQFARTALGPVLERLQQGVQRGDTLTDAMAREPQVFDAYFLSMIRVAEARGGLPETLRRMAKHYESRQRLLRQARSALIYPASVLIIALLVGWLLTAFVLPKIVELLEDMLRGKADLPGVTRALIGLSHFMQRLGWWLLPVAFVASLFLLRRLYRTSSGKALIDRGLLWVPVIGSLLRKIDTARFAETLGTLLDAGVPVEQSFELTASVLRLTPLRHAVEHAGAEVSAGTELSSALDSTHQFAPDVIAMIETGEETGTIPESLQRLAAHYEDQVEYTVKNLGSLIKPVLVLVAGGIVFFIIIGFVMAYVTVILDFSKP